MKTSPHRCAPFPAVAAIALASVTLAPAALALATMLAVTAIATGALAQPYPSKPLRRVVPLAPGGRTGSRRGGCLRGGDGARPPGGGRSPGATLALATMLAVTAIATGALAQPYPSKPLRMVVPLAPGGPVDLVARILAARLSEQVGQQVVVDNRPGAGGSVGGEMVARATPDGHTVLVVANGTVAIAPNLMKLPYDATRDLAPVTLLGTSPQALLVHPGVPAKSVRELIELAQARPGSVNFASSGQGATSHLASELFKVTAKIDIVHVPYKGAGPALTDLVAGQTQMMITGVSSALPYVKQGRLRLLGVTRARRIALLPEVPAIAETLPGYDVTTWYGLLTTARTPAPVIARLHRETVRALESAEVRGRLAGAGVEVETSNPEKFTAMIREETAKWGKLVKSLGITLQ
jgi:tripartite-type tricarboxylate transporter receptor subunit TctC